MHADNDIIRIPRVSQSPAFKFFIELVQIDVCEQGAQVSTLCGVWRYAELINGFVHFKRFFKLISLHNAYPLIDFICSTLKCAVADYRSEAEAITFLAPEVVAENTFVDCSQNQDHPDFPISSK